MLGDLTGLDVVEDPGLRETDGGRWQGLTRDEIIDQDRDLFHAWVAGHDVRPPGGEVRSEVVARVMAAVNRHVAVLPAGGTLVVVSHGGSIRGAIGGLLGLAPEQWTALGVISNCAWSVLSQLTLPAEPGGAPVTRWRLEEYNAAAAPGPAPGSRRRLRRKEEATRDRPRSELEPSMVGGAEGTRTPDPLHAMQVRYQLRHSPERPEGYPRSEPQRKSAIASRTWAVGSSDYPWDP